MAGNVDRPLKSLRNSWKLRIRQALTHISGFLTGILDGLMRQSVFQQGLKLDPHNISCCSTWFYCGATGDSAEAETMFQNALRFNPDYPDALLELANLRIAAGKFSERRTAAKYVRVSRNPATGYYKLAKSREVCMRQLQPNGLSVFRLYPKTLQSAPIPSSIYLTISTIVPNSLQKP